MWEVWKYISYIRRSRISIKTQTNLLWWNYWINIRWRVVMIMWWHALMRVCCRACIIIISMILMDIFFMHTPCNIFLSKPKVGNV